MKISIILLLAFCHTVSAQNSVDTIIQIGGLNRYDTIPPKKLENANLRVWYEFSQQVKKEKELQTITDTMTLITGNNYSVYYDWNRELKYKNMLGQLDAAKKTTENITYQSFDIFSDIAIDQQRLAEFSLNRDNSEILKDRTKGMVITSDMDDADILDEKFYLLEEEIPPQEWLLEDSEREVMGYLCQKATCHFRGRDYTAWFTSDIPLNDGPYKFYGLPGLIIMLEDSEKQFFFKAIGLETLSNVEIVSEDKTDYLKCTPEQYSKIKKRMQETVFLYYSKGVTLYVTKKRIPIEYTPIESY